MRRVFISICFAAVLCTLLAGCSPQGSTSGGSDSSGTASRSPQAVANIERLKAYNAAFNRHDVDAMMSMVSQDIEWLSVNGAAMAVEAQGAAALRESMIRYFALPNVENPQSSHGPYVVDGPFIAVQETATWGPEGERSSQSSLAVYEIETDKVRRVWYYPVP